MLYVFDADGTLRITKSGKPCPNEWKDQEILPNVKSKLWELKDSNIVTKIAIVSNQGGVSCGYMTEREAWQIFDYLDYMLARVVNDIKLCFYHAKGEKRDRYLDKAKPKPDMILELIEDFKVNKDDVLFVGNERVDEECARNADVKFQWAHEFFDWKMSMEIDIVEEKNGYFPRKKIKKEVACVINAVKV